MEFGKLPKSVLATGAIGAMLLAGCSESESPKPDNQRSEATQTCNPTGNWQSVSPDLNAKKIAAELRVSEDAVRAGQMGAATCPQGITYEDTEHAAPVTKVAIHGRAPYCLAFMVFPPKGQQLDVKAPYEDVGVVCPKE